MSERDTLNEIEEMMREFGLSSATLPTEDGFYMLTDVGGTIVCEYYENDEFEGEEE